MKRMQHWSEKSVQTLLMCLYFARKKINNNKKAKWTEKKENGNNEKKKKKKIQNKTYRHPLLGWQRNVQKHLHVSTGKSACFCSLFRILLAQPCNIYIYIHIHIHMQAQCSHKTVVLQYWCVDCTFKLLFGGFNRAATKKKRILLLWH